MSTNTLTFSGFDSLVGGDDVDFFFIAEGYEFAGSINGGAGVDVLDYSAYSTDVITTVIANDASLGLTGSSAGLADGFASIESILAGSGNNAFTGLNDIASFEMGTTIRYIVDGLFIDLQKL